MSDNILLKHSELSDLLKAVNADQAEVRLFDPKQAYFQLKSAYDYIQSELKDAADAFAACPVVLRGGIEAFIPVGNIHLKATLITDVVMHLAYDAEEGLFALPLNEGDEDPTVDVNVVDVVFDAAEGFEYVTEPFDLSIPNTVVKGQSTDPTDFILFNLKNITNEFSYTLDFSSIHTAIENMSVAIVNSK